MLSPLTRSSLQKALLTGIMIFLLIMTLTHFIVYQRYLIIEEARENEMLREVNMVKDRFKSTLNYSFSATKTLAFMVEEYGVPKDFELLGKDILETNKHVDIIELTQGGVITHIYPLKGNESAIGYDILKDTTRNREAFTAIEKRELFFAGPLELKQGGTAIIGRLPIFKNDSFRGFSAAIVRLSTLLKAVGIDTYQSSKYVYQLSKINPTTHKEEFFLPRYDQSGTRTIKKASVQMSDGEWNLSIMTREEHIMVNLVVLYLFGIMLSVTAGFFAWHLARQPVRLNRLVEEKTRQLAASESYFRSLIEKSSDGIVLMDAGGKVLYQSFSAERISGYSLKEMQELDGLSLIHPDDREEDGRVFQELAHSPGTQRSRTHRFRHRDGHYLWLQGTYSNLLNDDNVKAIVYNYSDASERIEAEQKTLVAQEQLATEKNFSESIINSLPGMFYIYDIEGRFIKWNRNCEIVTGYTAEEISHMHPEDFLLEAEIPFIREKRAEAFKAGKAELTGHILTKDKRSIPYYIINVKTSFSGTDYLIGVGIDISDRIAAENELLAHTREIKRLTAHMGHIQEEERTRIAREIHDELGQQLTGLKLNAHWIRKRLDKLDVALQEKMSDMLELIDGTIKTIRRIASELRPGILDDLGLMSAIEWQGQEFEKQTGVKLAFTTNMNDFNPERQLAINIFRVYQEALTNITRHADATLVETSLENSGGHIILTIKDNGCGFEKENVDRNSLGLIGMKERALSFHGELTISSGKEKGTVITLKLPVNKTDIS
jgi:PAS domain S-box-containing protein